MSLWKKANIDNSYNKNAKKSIYIPERKDIFIIASILVLLLVPLIIKGFSSIATRSKQVDLYLSVRYEEFFGKEMMDKIRKGFEEQNPDLNIKLLYLPEERGKDLADKEPDILVFDKGEFSRLVAMGALLPLETFAEEQTVEETAETEGGESAETTETTVVKIVQPLAIPLVSFMDLLYYNIELLQAAGFDRPPKTREEFLVFSRTISGSGNEALSDVKGSAMGLSPQDRQSLSREIFSWIWAAGYDFWSGEDERPVINTRQIGRDIAFFGNLYRDAVITPESFDMTGDQVVEQFVQGKIAMMIASSRVIHILREKMDNEVFGITTIPSTDPIGKYSIALSGTYAGINSACENPGAALAFLDFLHKQKPLICAQLKAVPGDVSELFSGEYKDYMKEDPFSSKAWSIFEASKVIQGFAGKEGGDSYENIFREETKKFFEDNQTYTQRAAEAAARTIEQRWEQIGLGEKPARSKDIILY